MKPDYTLQRQRQLAQQTLDAELLAMAEARTAAVKAKVREMYPPKPQGLVQPYHSPQYTPDQSSTNWSPVVPAAILGAALAFDIL